MSPEAARLAFLAALEAEKRRRAEREDRPQLPLPTPGDLTPTNTDV